MRSPGVSAVFFLFLLTGCDSRIGSGIPASEERTTPSFTAVSLRGSPDVDITVGAEHKLKVETDDNLLEIIATEVEDETLVIRATESYRTTLGVKVTINTPRLAAIQVSGSGDIQARGVQSTDFRANVTGSGSIVASGSAETLTVATTGSGDIDLSELSARKVDASVTGSGDIRVHAIERLSARVGGSGDIRYLGNPMVEKNISGSGGISPAH